MEGMPEQSGSKFEEAMNICTKQGKKLRMGMKFTNEKFNLDFDCVEKNE